MKRHLILLSGVCLEICPFSYNTLSFFIFSRTLGEEDPNAFGAFGAANATRTNQRNFKFFSTFWSFTPLRQTNAFLKISLGMRLENKRLLDDYLLFLGTLVSVGK